MDNTKDTEISPPTYPATAKQNQIFFWFAYTVLIAILIYRGPEMSVPLWDIGNDDAMRLVQVRDLLDGQSWFDRTQYRLGFDLGTPMHWSRLVDLPIAAFISLFSLFLSQYWAEALTMYVWPFLLAGCTLWLIQRGARSFGGPSAATFSLIFTAISIVVSGKFDPGSLDHHNVQITLLAALLLIFTENSSRFLHGALAGLLAALILSIGLEAMIIIAAICLYYGLVWAWLGEASRKQTIGFSAAFALTFALVFLVTRPDRSESVFKCDSFTADLFQIGSIGTFGLLVLAIVASRLSKYKRIISLTLLGIGVLVAAHFLAPSCLENPLDQLHPDVVSSWLAGIDEAETFVTKLRGNTSLYIGYAIVPMLTLVYVLLLRQDKKVRARAQLFGFLVIISFGMTLYQVRGVYFLMLVCTIPISAIIGALHERYSRDKKPIFGVVVIAVFLASVPHFWSLIYGLVFSPKDKINVEISSINNPSTSVSEFRTALCTKPEMLSTLSSLPDGLVVASADLGAGLLYGTQHRVLTSNFHRNQDGILASIQLAEANANDARELLKSWNVDYVALCQIDARSSRRARANEDGMWYKLFYEDPPDYLQPIKGNEGELIKVYRLKY